MLDFLKRKIESARATEQAQQCSESTDVEMIELHEDEFFSIYSSVSGAGSGNPVVVIGKL